MHLPNHDNYQELLATPSLVRFTHAIEDGKLQPTLLIKAHSLLLKYILQGVRLQVKFFNLSNGMTCYALFVQDDPPHSVALWSIVGSKNEEDSLRDLASRRQCTVYLFNELCVNCAWSIAKINVVSGKLPDVFAQNNSSRGTTEADGKEVSRILDSLHLDTAESEFSFLLEALGEWAPLGNTFVLNGRQTASLDLLNDNEGTHQEEIAMALVGDLAISGAFIRTVLKEPSGEKEFADVLLTYTNGTIIIESKCLSVFDNRSALPPRSKLEKNLQKSARRAIKQLSTATRKLREGVEVYSASGELLKIERKQPVHAIVLVPELDLLQKIEEPLLIEVTRFMETQKGFLHILDTIQLFRMVQAAEMIASGSSRTTKVMAFDYYLIERAKFVAKNHRILFDMILRPERG
jgi:hypothetical protein